MNKDNVKAQMIVKDQVINIIRIDDNEYISLTDLARYADEDDPRYPIQNWMRNKDVISYLGLWESINNENFKGVEFDTFKNEAGSNKFKISPQKWIRETNAVGMISKSGNNGGTYARSDIAFEFASWLSPEFKLYLIQEFQRLKKNEAYQNKIDWHANRVLAKVSYIVQTEAERDTWCNDKKVNCITKTEYSDSVAKDGFVGQSIAADKEIYEGDKITIVISLGKEPTSGQKNALKKAESYSFTMHMSKKGIYKQLTSEYGEGFTDEEAQYAIDHLDD